MKELDLSDLIQIIGIATSLLTSIIAIVISIVTLRQNSRMIESEARPYITVYANTTQFSSPVLYLVLKNFGSSSATITKFKCNVDLSKYTYNENAIPFGSIIGTTLNPNQKIVYPLMIRNNKKLESVSISISYKSSTKTYCENLTLNLSAYYNSLDISSYDKAEPFKSISYAIQDISRKTL